MAQNFKTVIVEISIVLAILLTVIIFYRSNKSETSLFPINPISSLDSQQVYPIKGLGPNGEAPNSISSIIAGLSSVNADEVAAKNYKVAIAMHDLNNDWSKALVKGIEESLAYYGISPFIITDGEFDIKKQLADYKNIKNLKPDVLITLPVDTNETSEVLLGIANSGVEIVFIDTVAEGFKFPDNYKGWVVGDSYVLGTASAEILAEKISKKGKVALLLWSNKMFTVDQRAKGAKAKFAEYEDIEIVKEIFFEEFYQIGDETKKLLDEYPDLDGLWAVWDTPAFEAIAVIKEKNVDVKVTCVDMSSDVANSIVNNDVLVGTAADHPYDAGVGVALLSIAALEKIQLNDYYVVPAEAITKENIESAWKNIYKQEFKLN